jgi:hypothetical protein
LRRKAIHDRLQARIGLQHIPAHPSLRTTRAKRRRDEPDGLVDGPLQIARKQVADGRESGHGLRRADNPLARHILQRQFAHLERNSEFPDFRTVGRRDLLRLIGDAGEPLGHARVFGRVARHHKIHIRLPGPQPDFPDEDVYDLDRILTCDGHLNRVVRSPEIGQVDHPFPIRSGRRGLLLAGDAHRDLLARIGPPPDRHRHALLQDHVVAE